MTDESKKDAKKKRRNEPKTIYTNLIFGSGTRNDIPLDEIPEPTVRYSD